MYNSPAVKRPRLHQIIFVKRCLPRSSLIFPLLRVDMSSFVDESDQILACAAHIVNTLSKRQRRHPWYWQRRLVKSRTRYSSTNLLSDLRLEGTSGFSNFCRMSTTYFEYLPNLVITDCTDAVSPLYNFSLKLT